MLLFFWQRPLQRCARLLLWVGLCVGGLLPVSPALAAAEPAAVLATPSQPPSLEPVSQNFASSEESAAEMLVAQEHKQTLLTYTALGLGLLNMLLLYMLYRSPNTTASENIGSFDATVSTRTEKRLDKRKREVEDLSEKLEKMVQDLRSQKGQQLTVGQIQDLVRATVRDELTRQATPSS